MDIDAGAVITQLRAFRKTGAELSGQGENYVKSVFKVLYAGEGKIFYTTGRHLRYILEEEFNALSAQMRVEQPRAPPAAKRRIARLKTTLRYYPQAVAKTLYLISVGLFANLIRIYDAYRSGESVSADIWFNLRIARRFWEGVLGLWLISAEIHAVTVAGELIGGPFHVWTQALEGPKGILNIGKDIFGVAEEAAGQATSFANEHALSRFGVELPQMREGSMASLASGGQNRQGVEGLVDALPYDQRSKARNIIRQMQELENGKTLDVEHKGRLMEMQGELSRMMEAVTQNDLVKKIEKLQNKPDRTPDETIVLKQMQAERVTKELSELYKKSYASLPVQGAAQSAETPAEDAMIKVREEIHQKEQELRSLHEEIITAVEESAAAREKKADKDEAEDRRLREIQWSLKTSFEAKARALKAAEKDARDSEQKAAALTEKTGALQKKILDSARALASAEEEISLGRFNLALGYGKDIKQLKEMLREADYPVDEMPLRDVTKIFFRTHGRDENANVFTKEDRQILVEKEIIAKYEGRTDPSMKERKALLAAMARLKDVQPELRDLRKAIIEAGLEVNRIQQQKEDSTAAKEQLKQARNTLQRKEKEFYLAAIHLAEKDMEAGGAKGIWPGSGQGKDGFTKAKAHRPDGACGKRAGKRAHQRPGAGIRGQAVSA